MGKQVAYLIIGNGIAGVTAAETLRSIDRDSTITIVADDPFPVYYRPTLKDFLAGRVSEEKLWARPDTFYQKQRVKFIPGRVSQVHPHFIQLQNGERLEYRKLLLAPGARPRPLDCPGLNLAGVSTLRTVADYQEILRRLPDTSRIVVYGSGPLALESAETLRHRGYAITHLLRKQTLWSEILDATASDMVLQEERRAGIDVRTGETVAEVVGKRGQVTAVVTTGGTRIPCDLLLIAIGIEPNIDFIQTSGIACNRGVKVDAAMRTNVPDIYAAGDVIETTDAMTGHTRVLGQWFPAIQQARTAAYSMLDQPNSNKPATFYNATSLYGLDFVAIGVTFQPELLHYYQEIVAEPEPQSYRKVLLKDGIPVGALLLGDRDHALSLKRAIDHRVNLTPVLGRLFAVDFRLDEWLDKQNIAEAIFDISSHSNKNVASSAYLVPISDDRITVPVKETPLSTKAQNDLIGRQTGATLYIEHSSVSRRHAEISSINGHYVLRDMGSSNGTFVNNVPLPPNKTRTLHQDDKVRFGDVQFRFQLRAQSSNRDIQNIVGQGENVFLHSFQLHNDMTRNIPEALLAAVKDKTSFVLLTKGVEPRTIPVPYEQFAGKRLTLGRDKDNTIVLNDTAASRQHAEIFGAPDGFYIRDLNSSNGVFVNKVKINNPYHLTNGDRVVVGNTLLYCSFPQIVRQPISGGLSPLPTVKTRVLSAEPPEQATSRHPLVVGLGHRKDIQPLSDKRIQFEIDMCVGCDRCMAACPIPMSSTVRIADLNQATISDEVATSVTRFTHECIMCGSCVPVCPVDNHRDLLMLSLKQRLGVPWDGDVDVNRVTNALPPGWSVPLLISRLREQPILSDTQQVPENYLLHLFASSQLVALETGATLLREGEYGRDLYFLLEGRLSISTLEVGNKELQIAILNRGEYTGEYGMLTGQPHHTTVRTLTPTLVLQVPEQVMQHFMELVPQSRRFFEQFNNVRSIEGILKRVALFQGVSDADIRGLVEQTRVQQYTRDEYLFTEDDQGAIIRRTGTATVQPGKGRPARETLHILLEGFVKVSRLTTAGTGQNKSNERIIAYRQGGDYFAGGLDLLGDGRAATVSAITRTRVAEIPRAALLELFKRYPEVNQRFTVRLREYIESNASAQSAVFAEGQLKPSVPQVAPADSTVRAGLHSLIHEGVVEGTEVLVIDLDKCIHCNECEEACERRHGHSRMNRKGMVVENISIATSCRQCQDPVCMLCSRAGIARRPNGEVYITESCIGCGICAERCPYGAISIVNLNEDPVEAVSWKRFSSVFAQGSGKEQTRTYLPMATGTLSMDKHVSSGPLDFTQSPGGYDELRKKIAIKCDLCAGYKDQACVQACPTGAAIRVQPTKFFGSTEEILRRRAH